MGICRRHFGLATLAGLAIRPGLSLLPRPKLLVLVILGLTRSDTFLSLWPQLSSTGLRHILEKGAYFLDCRHTASTWPSTTTATLATGTWPDQHGIVADFWYDRAAKAVVTASEEEMLATTLASEIAAEPRTRVYVAGMDGAQVGIFSGTPAANLYWMDENGLFVTRSEAPDWLDGFNRRSTAPEKLHDARWLVLGGRTSPENTPTLRILNFSAGRPREFMTLYKSSPFAQTALFDFMSELIARERLGQKDTFDFVCLLAGASTRLGYETGARSPLLEQMTLHLDRSLEALLAQCNRGAPSGPGDGNFNLVLAGSHGAPPEPPADKRVRMAVKGEAVAQAVDDALRTGGMGRVEKYVYPFLYLDTNGFRDPEEARRAAARAAMGLPAVNGYYTAAGACSVHDDWERRFRNSFHPKRSGDLMLSYQAGYIEDSGKGRGISYGSLYNYDVSVPLCFYGPQFTAGSYESPVQSVDVAPTLARVSGVAAPSSSTGRILTEALAE